MGQAEFSKFAFGPAFEGQIDLRDLGSPENIRLVAINAMNGVCCESPTWHPANAWTIQGLTPSAEESWLSPTPIPTAEEVLITPTVQAQTAGDQQPTENETIKILLPVAGGFLLIMIMAGLV